MTLAACTPTTSTQAAGPLDGFWAIETIAPPDSGCTFGGRIVMERLGESVQYRAALEGQFTCPDGRNVRTLQACNAYDLAVLQVVCTVDPEMATADYPGDVFNMQRPNMQTSVDEMEGALRRPESELRSRPGEFLDAHVVRWRRLSSSVEGP
jgi:hypothetical protein